MSISSSGCSAVVSATILLRFSSGLRGWPDLLRDLGDLERHRLLGSVRVLVARVDLQLREHLTAQGVLREHALDGLLDGLLGVLVQQLVVADGPQTTRVAGVAVSPLLGSLVV